MPAESPLGSCRGRGETEGRGVSSGGGAAAGTWGRKTRPGTRAAAGAKNNARAPAPTAARRVPSGRASARARSGVPRTHSTAPEALAARGGASVARGSQAPGSAQARQSPQGSSEALGGWRRPPGPPRLTRGHRLPSFAPPPTGRGDPSGPGSRPAVRIVVAQAGAAGAGRTPPPTVSHLKPSPARGTACTRVGTTEGPGPWAWLLHLVSSLSPALGTGSLPTQFPLGFLGGADPFSMQRQFSCVLLDC